jgi:hypothetical protein
VFVEHKMRLGLRKSWNLVAYVELCGSWWGFVGLGGALLVFKTFCYFFKFLILFQNLLLLFQIFEYDKGVEGVGNMRFVSTTAYLPELYCQVDNSSIVKFLERNLPCSAFSTKSRSSWHCW